jgi:hypothetical protein
MALLPGLHRPAHGGIKRGSESLKSKSAPLAQVSNKPPVCNHLLHTRTHPQRTNLSHHHFRTLLTKISQRKHENTKVSQEFLMPT